MSSKSVIPYRGHLPCKSRVKRIPQVSFAAMANPKFLYRNSETVSSPLYFKLPRVTTMSSPSSCFPPWTQCQCLVPKRHWKMANKLPHHGAQEIVKIMSASLQVFRYVHKRTDFHVTILSQITTSQSWAKYHCLSIRRRGGDDIAAGNPDILLV